MDLINFFRVLLRRKWLILAITSVAAVTTFLISRQAPKVYKAVAQLSTGISEGTGIAFTGGYSRGLQKYEIEARFKHMEEMIRSPQVLELVSYRLMLHDLEMTEPYRSLAKLRATYSSEEIRVAQSRYQTKLDSIQTLFATDELERKHIQILRSMRYDYQALRTTLMVKRIPGTDYIGLEFVSENPYLSAFVVNTLSQEFIRYYAKIRSERAQNSIGFFAERVAEKKAELDDKVKAWETFQKAQGRDVSNPMHDLMVQINKLEQQRELANEEVFDAERRLIELQNQLNESNSQSYLGQELSRGQNLSQLLRSRLSRLNARYVRNGFRSSARDSLDNASKELAAEIYSSLTGTKTNLTENRRLLIRNKVQNELKLDLARERIELVNEELQKVGNRAGTFTSSGAYNSPLGKELEVARDAYLVVLRQLNEAKISALDVATGEVSQETFVQPPEHPEPSKTAFLTVLSALVSLALCAGILFLLEYLDVSIRFPSRFTPMTGMNMIGTLNRLNTHNLDLVSLFGEAQKNQSLESYKQLLRKIRYEVEEAGEKNILITSTRSGTGKTSLLVSLAYSMSLNGKKVLLIDTHFKRNSLTQITAATPSLERYLNKEISRKMLVSNSVFQGVDVIGCEGGEFSPTEVFAATEFETLLQELAQDYDFILMEGPELNSYADSKELVRFSNKVIPVFSATVSVNAADKESIAYLETLDDQLMGSVLNKVEMRHLNR